MSNNKQRLDELAEQIVEAKVCADLATQATQLVFGVGNPDAEIVFIGEAPGKKEDIMGEPFVGASGKFLNEMLAMIGLKREDIYITNIVKYRPPNNRDPLPEEKLAFLPYLQKQLEIIKAKLIVTLGRHSMNAMLPGAIISQVHGQPKKVRIPKSEAGSLKNEAKTSEFKLQDSNFMTQVILPLYHPAAALYNGSMRQTLIDDFARIPLILDSLETPRNSVSFCRIEPAFSSFDVAMATSLSEKTSSLTPKRPIITGIPNKASIFEN